jgi:hypothetical protein
MFTKQLKNPKIYKNESLYNTKWIWKSITNLTINKT